MHLPTVAPSERSFSPQTVCVWNSGVFAARALNPSIPGTVAEVIALAVDSGVPGDLWKKVGQANFTKLAAGMKKRYGLVGTVIEGAAAAQKAVLAAAAAGPIVVGLAGDQYNLSPRWQNNHIGHAIAVLYEHGTTGLQFDPLAPAGYAGDPFPPAELAKFCTAAIIFKEELDMQPVILRPVRQEWMTGSGDPGGVFYTGGPGLGARKHFNAAVRVTSIAEDVTAAGLSGNWRLVLYGSELLWIPRASITPIAGTRVPEAGFGLSFATGHTDAALADAKKIARAEGVDAAAKAAAAVK